MGSQRKSVVLVLARADHPVKNHNLFQGSMELARELDSTLVGVSSRIGGHPDPTPNGTNTPVRVEKIYSAKTLKKLGFAGIVWSLLSSGYQTFRVVIGAKSRRREIVMNYVTLGISTGDVIYDNVIRNNLSFIRFRRSLRKLFTYDVRVRFAILWFRKILATEDIRALCISSFAPLEESVLARVAVSEGIPVFVGGGKLFGRYVSFGEIKRGYHWLSREEVAEVSLDTNWASTVDNYLSQRFSEFSQTKSSGFLGLRDLEEAYRGKKVVDFDSFVSLRPSQMTETKPVVVVSLHCFSDYPHNSGDLLFLDHFEAFIETIEIISENDSVNWVIKPHPSAHLYGEVGLAEDYVVRKQKRFKNLSLWPSEISMRSALNWAHGFVTVNGTIGMEAACFGKPVLLGGSSSYGHLGFSMVPESIKSYRAHLMNAQYWSPLAKNEIVLARQALYCAHNLGDMPKVGSNVVGYSKYLADEDKSEDLARLARGEIRKVWMS